jgi:hypothetical protein
MASAPAQYSAYLLVTNSGRADIPLAFTRPAHLATWAETSLLDLSTLKRTSATLKSLIAPYEAFGVSFALYTTHTIDEANPNTALKSIKVIFTNPPGRQPVRVACVDRPFTLTAAQSKRVPIEKIRLEGKTFLQQLGRLVTHRKLTIGLYTAFGTVELEPT